MIYSLILCTVIYVIITLVITGMVNYSEFKNVTDPLAYVFQKVQMPAVDLIVSISAVVATTSVLLVFQLGQPRIWMSMSRDGLLPKKFSNIHPRFRTPSFATYATGLLVGIPVLFIDDGLVTDLTSIGTLFAFVLVCGGVLILPLRPKEAGKFNLPYINGKFIVPIIVLLAVIGFGKRLMAAFANLGHEGYQEVLFILFILLALYLAVMTLIRSYSLIPVMGMLCCAYLMIEIPMQSWILFFAWMGLGLVIYFTYSVKNSKLSQGAS
jgi:amino acid transporter